MVPIVENDNPQAGISMRVINQFFEELSKLKPEVRSYYKFYASMFQIYNEGVFDLLNFSSEEGFSNNTMRNRGINKM